MSRCRLVLALPCLAVLVAVLYWTCHSEPEIHPAVLVAKRWAEGPEWSLVSHTEPRWRSVHGDEAWLFRAKFLDQDLHERKLWLLVQEGHVLLPVPTDSQSTKIRENAADCAAAYGP